jgi:hypothetical protein
VQINQIVAIAIETNKTMPMLLSNNLSQNIKTITMNKKTSKVRHQMRGLNRKEVIFSFLRATPIKSRSSPIAILR